MNFIGNYLLLLWFRIVTVGLTENFVKCDSISVQTKYTPEGHEFKLGDVMHVYETKNPSSKVLIGIYDVLGFTTNVLQVADKIAEAGFRVVMPDFFRGGWSVSQSPSSSRDAFNAFVSKDVNKDSWGWDSVKTDLMKILDHYKGQGVTKFGIFGWCWGGKMVVEASSSTEFSNILVGGLLHPARVSASDADNVKRPLVILPSNGEKSMAQSFFDKINAKFDKGRCEIHEFYDMAHGFSGGSGNFDDATIKKRVVELIKILQEYFKKELKE